MPDLRREALHAFWDGYDRRTLYRIVVALESAEYWTVDSVPKVDMAILKLGEAIDNAEDFEITDEAPFMRLFANVGSMRAMRILQSLDMVKPGTASKLLMHAEEITKEGAAPKPGAAHAKVFLQRNLVFERLQLLARVFSPQRVSLAMKALEKTDEKS